MIFLKAAFDVSCLGTLGMNGKFGKKLQVISQPNDWKLCQTNYRNEGSLGASKSINAIFLENFINNWMYLKYLLTFKSDSGQLL